MQIRRSTAAVHRIESALRSDVLVLDRQDAGERDDEGWPDSWLTEEVPVTVVEAVVEAPRPTRPVGGDAREAAILFRQTAVALTAKASDQSDSRAEARQCAIALLQMADAGEEEILASHVRPDLGKADCTWTVACYQIGDLSPTSLRDFPEAVPAVLHLADCESRAHVAAELIAASGDGVRWTALVRSGAEVRFQLFDQSTGTADTPELVSGAKGSWDDQLRLWAYDPARDLDAVRPEPSAPPAAPDAGVGVAVGQVLEAVHRIEALLSADDGMASRIATLEAAQQASARQVEALRAELARVTGRARRQAQGRRRPGWSA